MANPNPNTAQPGVPAGPQPPRDPNNPYGVTQPNLPQAPAFDYGPGGPQGSAPYEGMDELFSMLTERMGMDEERARAVLDRYKKEYAQGSAIQKPLLAEDQDIVSRGSLDPNDSRTYGRYAGEAIGAAHDKDLILRQLEEAGIEGGELDAAKAGAITGLFNRVAGQRQDAIGAARDRLYSVAKDKTMGFSPGEDSGSGGAMLNYYGNRANAETAAATQRYGIDVNRDTQVWQQMREDMMQKYGIDIGAAGQYRSQDIQQQQSDRNYELGKEDLKLRQQAQKKPSLLGGLLRTVGGIAATALGGPAGGAIFGGLTGLINGGGGSASTFSPGAQAGTTQMNTGGYATNLPQPYRP